MWTAPSSSWSWWVTPGAVVGNYGKVRIGIEGYDRATICDCRRCVDTELAWASYRLDRVAANYRRIRDRKGHGRVQHPVVFPAGSWIDEGHPDTCDSA